MIMLTLTTATLVRRFPTCACVRYWLTDVFVVQATVIPDEEQEAERLPCSKLVDNLFVFEKIKPSQLPANQ